MRTPILWLASIGCGVIETEPEPMDLVSPLGHGEARAGEIRQPAALFGGAAAEGQLGDFLLINDRVRFVVQGMRDSGGLLNQVGIVDADRVRPPGQPGRDLAIDWNPAVDIGHLSDGSLVEVVDDGVVSGTAHIRVTGRDQPLDYFNGAFEGALFAELGIDYVTDYVLRADTPLLEVTTTVNKEAALSSAFGDVLLTVPGLGSSWVPGIGRVPAVPIASPWVAYVDNENGQTVAMFREPDGMPNRGLETFSFLVASISQYGDVTDVEAGSSTSWTRWYGVGAAPSELSDAWQLVTEQSTEEVSTIVVVEGSGEPIAGARVTVLVDDAPWTLAFSDEQGRASALVPSGSDVRLVVDGSGSRLFRDAPEGAARYSAMSGEAARRASLDSLGAGAPPVWQARGHGRVEGIPGDTIALPASGELVLRAADGLPFEARLEALDGPHPSDELGFEAPEQHDVLAYSRDGEVTVEVEPGRYSVLVHRGVRYELVQTEVVVEAGASETLELSLPVAYEAPGWWTADTHMHAAPSLDGKISMADRLLVSAATGVQVHVSSEHDVLADYAPLLEPMGLADVVVTVPCVEVSPVLRGHANLFPVSPDPLKPAGGAWRWWLEPVETTTEQFERLREHHPDAVVQINHPFSPGMPQMAGWEPGRIGRPELWYEGFGALEVVKGGVQEQRRALYFDLLNRGLPVAAMGNTDSHAHTRNDPGVNITFVAVEAEEVGQITPEAFGEAIRNRRTIASNGPFLEMSISPGTTLTAAATLQVKAYSPSWIVVDRLQLVRDGEVIEVIEGTEASFELTSEADASFVVEALGDTGMRPLVGFAPWAISSPILLDLAGDGWDAPAPPLQLGE